MSRGVNTSQVNDDMAWKLCSLKNWVGTGSLHFFQKSFLERCFLSNYCFVEKTHSEKRAAKTAYLFGRQKQQRDKVLMQCVVEVHAHCIFDCFSVSPYLIAYLSLIYYSLSCRELVYAYIYLFSGGNISDGLEMSRKQCTTEKSHTTTNTKLHRFRTMRSSYFFFRGTNLTMSTCWLVKSMEGEKRRLWHGPVRKPKVSKWLGCDRLTCQLCW